MTNDLCSMLRSPVLVALSVICVLAVGAACEAQDIITVIQSGDVETARAMLKDDPSLALFTREDGDTPIHQAAFMGDLDLVQLLISLGAGPDARNTRNQSPLLYAAYNGQTEVCGFLIGKGAESDDQDDN
ncbi:MAG TPA: ankyrin repeat domain-containing protein, partial [Candidatus Krumholzibacterium sp.]|nr:ankyrin repeat domain-containing protein [Candidatus Krumholzibacterium sp.]